MPDWNKFFPFPDIRATQSAAIDFLLEQINKADDLFVEAPTGVGKSAVAIALARFFASDDAFTCISTTTISLEEQYMREFARLGLRQLHSKSHYPCPHWQTCDVGSRTIRTTTAGKNLPRCNEGDGCPYQIARIAFHAAPYAIANASYLCTCARFVQDWEPRDVAIFDEAHLLHDTIASGYSFDVHESEVEQFPDEGNEVAWLRREYSFRLDVQIRELEETVADADEDDPEISRICRRLERAEQKKENLGKILADHPDNWVFDRQADRLSISPLWATNLAANLLPRIGTKRIYLSATLPGFEQQARYLGIDPQKAKYLALPSPFPYEHRLIHICPVVKWKYPATGAEIAAVCRALEKILALHPNERGLVHVSSYSQAREIVAQCRSKRLVTHENAQDKGFRLEEMFARPGVAVVARGAGSIW